MADLSNITPEQKERVLNLLAGGASYQVVADHQSLGVEVVEAIEREEEQGDDC